MEFLDVIKSNILLVILLIESIITVLKVSHI